MENALTSQQCVCMSQSKGPVHAGTPCSSSGTVQELAAASPVVVKQVSNGGDGEWVTLARTAKGGIGWGVSSGVKTSNRFGVLAEEAGVNPTRAVKTKSAVLIGDSNVN